MRLSNNQEDMAKEILGDVINQARTMKDTQGRDEEEGYEALDFSQDVLRLSALVDRLQFIVDTMEK